MYAHIKEGEGGEGKIEYRGSEGEKDRRGVFAAQIESDNGVMCIVRPAAENDGQTKEMSGKYKGDSPVPKEREVIRLEGSPCTSWFRYHL